jgi:hypothetical protein
VILREERGGRSVETISWMDREIAACEFADGRLGRRLRSLLEQIGDAVGESVPMTCQDWANTKSAGAVRECWRGDRMTDFPRTLPRPRRREIRPQ